MKSPFFLDKKGLKNALQQPSSWVLIAVNLSLILAVIAWDWQIFDIVFLYWVENLVIGVINVLKMLAANPGNSSLTSLVDAMKPGASAKQTAEIQARIADTKIAGLGGVIKVILIPFFILHYGMFSYGHGVFIFAMFNDGSLLSEGRKAMLNSELLSSGMLFAIAMLAASHLFSFTRNFIGAGEYRRTHPITLMMRPYGRIIVLHITIILGAFMTMAFGSPLGLLIVLVVLKTAVDLAMHQSERSKFQGIY